jgi:hypothetical protein
MSEATHSYYDWQVSTLLLAYDAADPIARHDQAKLAQRQQAVEEELHQIAHAAITEDYRQNPQKEFPPEIIIAMTRATMTRAAEILGILPKSS